MYLLDTHILSNLMKRSHRARWWQEWPESSETTRYAAFAGRWGADDFSRLDESAGCKEAWREREKSTFAGVPTRNPVNSRWPRC